MIEITLEFTKKDLNQLLENCYFGDGKAPKVKDLTRDQIQLLGELLLDSARNFAEEIIDTARDHAANGWLEELTEQF